LFFGRTSPGTVRRAKEAGATPRGTMGKASILAELLEFLLHRKKWWLAPILILLVLLSLLIVLSEGSAIAPFIYTLF